MGEWDVSCRPRILSMRGWDVSCKCNDSINDRLGGLLQTQELYQRARGRSCAGSRILSMRGWDVLCRPEGSTNERVEGLLQT
jgi:hypothetical protein